MKLLLQFHSTHSLGNKKVITRDAYTKDAANVFNKDADGIKSRNMIISITTFSAITARDSLLEKKSFIGSHTYAIKIRISM
jgi:hypothetical protein